MLSFLLRTEVQGIVLVLLSVFTLLSLFTNSRGSITGAWIDLVRFLTGDGVWGVPLLTGALGLWMVIRAVDKMPDLPWQKPTGVSLIFLAYITGASLLSPSFVRLAQAEQGEAGGWIGFYVADFLEAALSLWGAWAAVTALGILGIVLLTDRLLLDIFLDSWDALVDIWSERQQVRGQRQPDIQPSLPMPSGEIPTWKRWLDRFRRQPAEEGSEWIGLPASLTGKTPSTPAQQNSPAPAAAPDAARQPLTPASGEAALSPRIVGGVQQWQLPRLADMLDSWDRYVDSDEDIRRRGRLIEDTLALFGVPADFEGVNAGPTVTQFLIRPGYIERTIRGETKKTKIKVSKIAGLANDLALALAASNVRIEAPIPGTNYVGIEVPNSASNNVGLRELMESEVFQAAQQKYKLPIALGEDVKGKAAVADMARMPHLLIAGATGTGKSVCINSIIGCLLLTHTPETLRFLMIDPKMVELSNYNGVPHLLSPVVTEVDRAAGVLFWAVKEMERRYQLLSKANARDLERYNAILRKEGQEVLPFVVIVVDEMADLMMAAPEEVEKHICRLAQMARAVGIHLIIATQRPSVDVITGLIKANFPSRIAFAVTSQTDSRVVLDVPGADRLLGRGDMLFMAPDSSKLERLQGTWLHDDETNRIVRYWKGIRSLENYTPPPLPDVTAPLVSPLPDEPNAANSGLPAAKADSWTDPYVTGGPQKPGPMVQPLFDQIEQIKAVDARDDLFDEAVQAVREAGRGSTTLLQRKLRIGYSRASRLVEQLEQAGILGPDQGGNAGRAVLQGGQPTPQPSPPPTQGTPGGQRPTGQKPTGQDDGLLEPRIIGEDPDPPTRIWM
ncbi:MAG: DNA translocase FtsK 4TM domain-containing protein [Caldilineaceae bacterium]